MAARGWGRATDGKVVRGDGLAGDGEWRRSGDGRDPAGLKGLDEGGRGEG